MTGPRTQVALLPTSYFPGASVLPSPEPAHQSSVGESPTGWLTKQRHDWLGPPGRHEHVHMCPQERGQLGVPKTMAPHLRVWVTEGKGRGGVGTHELGPLTYQACLGGGGVSLFSEKDKDLKDWFELCCVLWKGIAWFGGTGEWIYKTACAKVFVVWESNQMHPNEMHFNGRLKSVFCFLFFIENVFGCGIYSNWTWPVENMVLASNSSPPN